MMRRCLVLAALLAIPGAGAWAQSAEDLQRELRMRDAEIRYLRQRVEALEKERLGPASGPPSKPAAVASKPAAAPSRPEDEDDELGRALERTLVQQGALVLAPWTFELQPEVAYVHWDRSRSAIRREFEGSLSLRAGLGWRSQLELRLPYRQVETESATATGAGNAELAWSTQLVREGGAPGLIGSLGWSARAQNDGLDGELPTGSGFDVLQAGLTAVRTRDPLVFFAGASYAVAQSREIAGTKVQPGEILGVRFGSALAATPHTSANVGLNLGFVRRARLNGEPVPDSDTTLGTLQIGFATVLSRRIILNLSGDFRVTGDVPDFRLTASLPIRF